DPDVLSAADEDRLWRLYTRSGALLPSGSRIRNLLWRMENRRRLGSSHEPREQTAPRLASAAPKSHHHRCSLDLRRRSSSRTVVGAEPALTNAAAFSSFDGGVARAPPSLCPHPAAAGPGADVDMDLELARPLELWGTAQFGDAASLLWMPPPPPLVLGASGNSNNGNSNSGYSNSGYSNGGGGFAGELPNLAAPAANDGGIRWPHHGL
ncbi:hypothetical protein EV174_004090, partial [Coemansia sp. RSA 2320]